MDPRLQREGDASLMEAFARLDWVTPKKLEKINTVRLCLKVVTIANLADEGGTYIPNGMLCGNWQVGSDLHRPAQSCPPQSLLQSYIASSEARLMGMHLNTKLGKWFDVPRNTRCQCYRLW